MNSQTNNQRPALKICGITTMADLRLVAQVGADFFGTIVHISRSPRNIGPDRAALLARAAPGYSETMRHVVVVEDPTADSLDTLVDRLRPHAFQIHADEAGATEVEHLCMAASEEVELWLAVGIPPDEQGDDVPIDDIVGRIGSASQAGVARIVLDTRLATGTGGTGKTSNWDAAAEIIEASNIPVMLAGGVNPDNIAEAVQIARPQGIDVSSGVEISPGRKDPWAVQLLAARLSETAGQ